MLLWIETGYEAECDFPPHRPPPSHPYLLASVPRSGSTYGSHILWQTGCLGAPLEYCNFEPTGPPGQRVVLDLGRLDALPQGFLVIE
jgi:hypothetical protein